MKLVNRILALLMLSFMFLSQTGCDHDDDYYYDDISPSPPTNIRTVTGDERVDIFWDHNPERDVAGYNVDYNFTYEGRYTLIGTTEDNYFIDFDEKSGLLHVQAGVLLSEIVIR